MQRKSLLGSIMVKLVRLYQLGISPYLGPNKCIFTPTCSQYAIESIEVHGPIKGLVLAVWRVLRCNPFNKTGGYDPVKPAFTAGKIGNSDKHIYERKRIE